MSGFSKEELRRMRADLAMTSQQIAAFTDLVQDQPPANRESLLQLYQSSGFDIKQVKASLSKHNKLVVSYKLMPDGTISEYSETPV